MGIPETALHPQELSLDDHSVICLHSLTRLALPVITITRGCGCLINPKQPCVVSIVTYRVTMGRTEIFKFDASTHHLRSCSSIHRTLVLRAIDFSRPFIFIYDVEFSLVIFCGVHLRKGCIMIEHCMIVNNHYFSTSAHFMERSSNVKFPESSAFSHSTYVRRQINPKR